MTTFTKTKIHFALALLGTLFALHPFLQKFEENGFLYLGYDLKQSYLYAAFAGLLSLCVYCFGVTLVSERPHSSLEKLGNYLYALAIMVLPLYGGLYLSSLLADQLGQSHLAWAAPSVALGLGIGWVVLSQLAAWLLRGRLADQDRLAKVEQLAAQEIAALQHAHELFADEHYDLSVMEVWKAIEARLHRTLLGRGIILRGTNPEALIHKAKRARVLHARALEHLQELKRHWQIAISTEPLTKEGAQEALSAARHLLATLPVPQRTRETAPAA
jgi:hypothetical protein